MKTKRLAAWVAVGMAAAGVAAVIAWTLWAPLSAERTNPDDRRQVAMGEAIYRQHCASCHGAKLEGQPDWRVRKADGRLPGPPHDETGHTWHHPDAQIVRIIRDGIRPPLAPAGYESDMGAFQGILTGDEMWAVLAFIKSQWPPQIRERQKRIDEAARR